MGSSINRPDCKRHPPPPTDGTRSILVVAVSVSAGAAPGAPEAAPSGADPPTASCTLSRSRPRLCRRPRLPPPPPPRDSPLSRLATTRPQRGQSRVASDRLPAPSPAMEAAAAASAVSAAALRPSGRPRPRPRPRLLLRRWRRRPRRSRKTI